ncbi:MAG: PASTA domain-containing protein [Herbiconiux sp.]|nr:PASTA domain-containing protein [Herbiconiux sp.]
MQGTPVMSASSAPTERNATTKELNRVLDQAVGSTALDRYGVFVVSGSITGQGSRRCVRVDLLNPSKVNITYLRSHYVRLICPSRKPAGGYAQTAMGCVPKPPPSDAPAVTVPDLTGLQPYRAARTLRAAGFAFSGCATTTQRPSRYSYENVLSVTEQRPAAGTVLPQGTAVGFSSRGILPGGFTVFGGATQ